MPIISCLSLYADDRALADYYLYKFFGTLEAQFSIEPHQRVVLSWGNCMYTFTSHHQEAVTWCDAEWVRLLIQCHSWDIDLLT